MYTDTSTSRVTYEYMQTTVTNRFYLKFTYAKEITKICKFERKLDFFTSYTRKGRGVQFRG